jgi:type IV secretory pathway TrbD component
MTMRARFLLLLGLVVLSWAAIPFGLAMTLVAGRFFASMLGWT